MRQVKGVQVFLWFTRGVLPLAGHAQTQPTKLHCWCCPWAVANFASVTPGLHGVPRGKLVYCATLSAM